MKTTLWAVILSPYHEGQNIFYTVKAITPEHAIQEVWDQYVKDDGEESGNYREEDRDQFTIDAYPLYPNASEPTFIAHV